MLKWVQLLVRTYTAGSWVGCPTPFCSDIWPDAKKASLVPHERLLAALHLRFYQGTKEQVESPTFPGSMLPPSWPCLDHVGISHASSLFVFIYGLMWAVIMPCFHGDVCSHDVFSNNDSHVLWWLCGCQLDHIWELTKNPSIWAHLWGTLSSLDHSWWVDPPSFNPDHLRSEDPP